VAYANPIEHEHIVQSSHLHATARLQLAWRPGWDWNRTQAVQFYEVRPAESSVGPASQLSADR
jgi:hypothetical protein